MVRALIASGVVCGLVWAGHVSAEDRIEPLVNEDGMYSQTWFLDSFLEMQPDLEDSAAEGKRFAIIFEQKGCIYCKKIHEEVLSDPKINAYIRENYNIVQLNLWGDRAVVDFDGEELPEKDMARKWGVAFTPTILFFPDDPSVTEGKAANEIEVARMPGAFGKITFLGMFEWVAEKGYEGDEHFQRYIIRKAEEAQAG
ncbi:MAG: thioredoxin family protein [Geminicoccaceae bacterium]